MSSLNGRLSWGLMASLVIVFGLQWAVMGLGVGRITEDQMASRLEHDADNIVLALQVAPGIGAVMDSTRLDNIFNRPFSGHYFVVQAQNLRFRSRSLWDENLAVDPKTMPSRAHIEGPSGQHLLALVRHYVKDGIQIWVLVGEDISHVQREARSFQLGYGVVCAAALVLLIGVQRRIIAGTLKPLSLVRQDMADLEHGRIDRLRETVPDEVRPLVQEVNRLLAAMGRRVERSRAALGNLAHALKTPLTLLAQVADRREMQDMPELRGTVVEETDKIRGLIERELKRARLAGAARPGARVPLAEGLKPLVNALGRMYGHKGLDIQLRLAPEVDFPGDQEDMLELFGNLLDNACKWAARVVRVTVTEDDGLTIAVEDDGPGCSDADLERLAQRGVRADESAPGHGLGLAITRDVAASYGGEIRFGRSEDLGGFLARVRIPHATAAPA
jgi:signal transduction histidine kinase